MDQTRFCYKILLQDYLSTTTSISIYCLISSIKCLKVEDFAQCVICTGNYYNVKINSLKPLGY